MKRSKILPLVNKKVRVEFFDGDIREGTLKQGKGIGNGYVDDSDNRWFILEEERLNFLPSHVRKMEEIL